MIFVIINKYTNISICNCYFGTYGKNNTTVLLVVWSLQALSCRARPITHIKSKEALP